MDSELQRFVRESLGRGLARAAIRERLLGAGWRPSEVETALGAYAEEEFPVPVPRRRPYVPARVAFLHLVLFATLYVTAFNVGAVLFVAIERWLPDVVHRSSYDAGLAALRNAVAGLVIALPVFLWMNRLIARSFARDPEQRASSVRKWLTYLTLFLAALVMIGDLVFLVTRLLSGELPLRVALKVAVVFTVAGVVFWHYLRDLQAEEAEKTDAPRRAGWLERIAVGGAIAVAIGGLVVGGTPESARRAAIDIQRTNNLNELVTQIDQYWNQHGSLPGSLEALNAGRAWIVPGRDPVTQEPYGYRTIDSTHYELCATFDAPAGAWGETRLVPESRSRFAQHAAGRQCFDLEVTLNRDDAPPSPR